MKKYVVTGADGFIGQWLVSEMLGSNIHVLALVQNKNIAQQKLPANNPNLEILECDISNYSLLSRTLSGEDFFCWIHLAWQGSTGDDRGNFSLQLHNAEYLVNAAKTAEKIGCKRFLGAGSLAEKDVSLYIPEQGSTPNLVSCYGVAKMTAHFMSKAFCNSENIDHLWVYLPNSYGEGNYTGNFVNFASIQMIKNNRASFTSGEQLYEFVYAKDTAAGILAVAERGIPNNSYYIGGNPKPLKEYVIQIRDTIDANIPLYLGEIPFNGLNQPREAFDATKLKEDTGFEISIPFSKGIKKTVSWLEEEYKKGIF